MIRSPTSRQFNLSLATVLTSLIAGLLLAQWWDAWSVAGRRVGIILDEADGGLLITAVADNEPADRAGLRADDLLTAINGHRIVDYDTLTATDELWRRGVPLTFTLIRDGATIERIVTPGASFPWSALAATAIPCLAYLAIGLLAFGESPNDIRIRLLFGFSLAVALEFALPASISTIPWWTPVQYVLFDLLTGLQIGLLLHLASLIPQPASWFRRSRWLPAGYYVVGAVIGIVTAASTVLTAMLDDPPRLLDDIGVVVFNSWVLPLWSVAVTGILAHQLLHAPTTRARRQAGMVFAGILPWAAYQLIYQLAVPMGQSAPDWLETIQPAALLVFPIAVFIAVFKFELLDITLVLRRSVALVLVTASLVALFVIVVGIGHAAFGSMGDATGPSIAAMSLAMLVLGLLFAPVRRSVQSVVDRRLFPERRETARRLTDLTAELPTLGSLPAMGKRMVDETVRVFGVETATLLVADPSTGVLVSLASSSADPDRRFGSTLLIEPDDPGVKHLLRLRRPISADQLAGASPVMARRLYAFNADLVAGMISGDSLAGLLILGPKIGGEPFHASELQMLNLFSHAAATVFENARLFESATYESLTGLMRRETIMKKLEAELQRSQRYRRPLSVGMADIDRFKRVNDRYGHLAGDTVLKQIASRLASGLRSTDLIGRYGGEEFLFILPETALEEALLVAEKLRTAIETLECPLEEAPNLKITVSIGLAAVDHERDEPQTATQLIREADRGLLDAKRTGRNRVVIGFADENAAAGAGTAS